VTECGLENMVAQSAWQHPFPFIAGLAFGTNYTDPNRLALALWIPQPRLLRLFLLLEGFRQRRKLTTDILEEQPPLDDSGHERFIAQAPLIEGPESVTDVASRIQR
jgi:hypothetical protein